MGSNTAEMSSSPASPFTLDPTQNLEPPSSPQPRRNRSVQFSMSASPKSGSHDQLPALEQHLAESSADEITPFSGRERGGQRSYDTTTAKGDGSEARGASKDKHPTSKRRASRRSSRQSGGDEDNEPEGWWHDFVDKYGSVELENKGSVARDHLALERTFLAWLRTSLAFASIGIAITQLFRLNATLSDREGMKPQPTNAYKLRQLGKPLGATFLGIAVLILIIGGRRYFESQ
ncbi:hypothetical protein MMC31_000630, partial [Peltigera leucophlebia]|nr:hypothetical protein [Peltigera leucophlebia]